MTGPERDWLLYLCYLDVVNEATISAMMPGVNAKVVLDWFTEEASVRDVAAPHFVVQPFIRQMLLGYHEKLIGSKERKALAERARAAMDAA